MAGLISPPPAYLALFSFYLTLFSFYLTLFSIYLTFRGVLPLQEACLDVFERAHILTEYCSLEN